MRTLRTKSLALLAAMLLVALSVSAAFGAHPEGESENRGHQVSSFVHSLIFGADEESEEESEEQQDENQEETDEENEEETDEETDEASDEETDEEQSEAEETNGEEPFKNHGQCVRQYAQSADVGGQNENHGGAVSLAARETCWETDTDEEPADEEASEEASAESDVDATEVDRPGKSGAAHQKAPGKNKVSSSGHPGRGHGRGGSKR